MHSYFIKHNSKAHAYKKDSGYIQYNNNNITRRQGIELETWRIGTNLVFAV